MEYNELGVPVESFIDFTGNVTYSPFQIDKRISSYKGRVTNTTVFLSEVDTYDTLVRADNDLLIATLIYESAVTRLTDYILSVGRPESNYEQETGQYTEEIVDGELVAVPITETIVVPGIDPLPLTVITTETDEEGTVTETEIDNPLVVTDVAERAAAQEVIDNATQEVLDVADARLNGEVYTSVTPEDQAMEETNRVINRNRLTAEAAQDLAIKNYTDIKAREALNLPVNKAPDAEVEAHVAALQTAIDSPSDSEIYVPPLPPGVTPPAVAAIVATITREAGWNDVLGWRIVLEVSDPEYVPANIAISVYSSADCTGYLYTPGALQFDSETGQYYAVCPAGQEHGDVDYHFGLLYGAAQLACWTLVAGEQEKVLQIYGE